MDFEFAVLNSEGETEMQSAHFAEAFFEQEVIFNTKSA